MYPGVTPMWDNTSRRKQKMFILDKSTPEKYGEWLYSVMNKFVPYSKDENFVLSMLGMNGQKVIIWNLI